MQLRVIVTKLTGRISRNVGFWLLMALYMDQSRGIVYPYYPILFGVLFVSYGIPGYIHNLWVIPKFLLKRKYFQYAFIFGLLLILTVIGSFYETHWINNRIAGLNYMGNLKNVAMPYHIFPSMLMFTLLAFGKFMGDAIKNQYRLELMEKEKLKGELESLRSQVNPHFLFNALNTIYGMARRTDQETADAVIKLSDILRHGLYDCEDTDIPMDKEILFIKQYIEFAQLRLYKTDSIQLDLKVDIKKQRIAPLLLIPFIENAIKHGLVSQSEDSWVKIVLSIKDNSLIFICTNSNLCKPNDEKYMSSSGGIGLKNVRRRLELLYPGKYTLEIVDDAEQFSVELNLELV